MHCVKSLVPSSRSDGEHWKRMRSQMDKNMMRPKKVATYIDDFNEVSSDFLTRMRRVRKEDDTINDMDKELFNWSLESKFQIGQSDRIIVRSIDDPSCIIQIC